MKIDWASSFRSDGSRRRPPPSTMHGWLAKMRGTLLGDERLRSRGIKEMREARAMREYQKQRGKQSKGGIFRFFSSGNKPSRTLSRGITGRGRRPTHSATRSKGQPPNRLVVRSSQRPTAIPRRSTGHRSHHSSRHSSRRPAARPHASTRRSGRR